MMPVASVAAIKVVHPITIARREPGRGTAKRVTPFGRRLSAPASPATRCPATSWRKNTLPRPERQLPFGPGFFQLAAARGTNGGCGVAHRAGDDALARSDRIDARGPCRRRDARARRQGEGPE